MTIRRTISRSFTTISVLTVLLGGCSSSGDQSSANPPFNGGNQPPQISGTPPTSVVAGNSYEFTPTATDADGDALTFSIQSPPSWATFDAATGRLAGSPGNGDIGSFPEIIISVSDGSASSSLPPFSISVDQVGSASVSLSWTAPMQNEDGSLLTDLAGFKIYYGQSSGSYANVETVDNPGLTSYVVENLSAGTYFFAATAFNSNGIESRLSAETEVTAN